MTAQIDYASEYDNSGRVKNSAALVNKYINDAAMFREERGRVAQYDLVYGPQPRNMMDIFWPNTQLGNAKKSPLVMFIHGGYWQRLDRSAFSHMAAGLNANGIAVAIPSYTLCPDITIEGIITEMRRACLVLFQTFRRKFTVIGHSAGGHLAACMMATDWEGLNSGLPHDLVKSGLGISGIYDLRPLLHTPINDVINLNEEQAIAASPIHWVPDALHQFDAWVGDEESREFHRQSQDLAAKWGLLGTPTQYISEPGTNHFTVIDALTRPDSLMVNRILELARNPDIKVELPEVDDTAIDAILNPPEAQAETQETVDEISEPQPDAAAKKPAKKTSRKSKDTKSRPKASIGGKAPPGKLKKKPKKSN